MAISPIPELLEDLRAGKQVILMDDEDRENEGDLVLAAEHATPEQINFMAKYGRGLICLALTPDQTDQLELPLMVRNRDAKHATNFTVSIEAAEGVTTGISAADRAHTIQTAIGDDAGSEDLVQPGHVFPLRAVEGGVLTRTGHTEASVDLARLAGLKPAGVICEIMNDDGTMARLPDLETFAEEHGLKIGTIADLVQYRMEAESLVRKAVDTRLPTDLGEFRVVAFESDVDEREHVALVLGDIDDGEPVLTRMHSECLTGDIFGSRRCDCQSQLHGAMEQIAAEGRGVIVYLRQEGRGIGLIDKLRAYNLQDAGRDTVEANTELGYQADLRNYGVGAQILRQLGVRKLRLMTNNPKKIIGLRGYGLEVVERVPLICATHPANERYLAAKRDKLGHMLPPVGEPVDARRERDRTDTTTQQGANRGGANEDH
ncbi:bifunctional 3,4-dihydroxy-2-butanone-4-phosphate synthase/GTP cyclohydrolase II [Thiohalorhabdus denitrificans]|uniref:Riboflavin biosynthesis protein RibBA n=1 Tax=Thiohalorhabdus denitrificans TaxID=381306 RepID=A0A1G5GHC6_9GAMM|nr:bifunctional 3,4-dihydroxy-2-butanone-4-phosphate synthase/GTP cyclohydrolase II [Thiohalorhabdus denitrificans]SCY50719.1 GTP cyclohydrolase II [Thiohalorhabdus denitrificans]